MTCIAKESSIANGKVFLQEAFSLQQSLLKTQLEMSSKSITHNGVLGDVNETHFIETIKKYLPRRYAIDSGIIIDSNGSTSDQIDVVIYDNQYTPTLLDQHNHRFIPAESVYAIFEVKPTIDKAYLDYTANKAESVRKLYRTSVAIPHAGGVYTPKPHFDIVAGIVATNVSWVDGLGTAFLAAHGQLFSNKTINCGLAVSGASFDTFNSSGTIEYGPSDNALLYFIFRLLQKLQTLGTVPAIDWNAYACQLK